MVAGIGTLPQVDGFAIRRANKRHVMKAPMEGNVSSGARAKRARGHEVIDTTDEEPEKRLGALENVFTAFIFAEELKTVSLIK
jgi:hypothetical protein